MDVVMDLVQRLFLPNEAEVIQGIASSSKLPKDRQVWAPITNRSFSVRSVRKIHVCITYKTYAAEN